MPKHDQSGDYAEVNPVTEITQVIEAEAANLRASITALGEHRKLASDVLGLYELIRQQVDLSAGAHEVEVGAFLVMLTLLNCCRFQLTMSVLQNWRGRAAEALAPLRKATELCASACYIRKHPPLADVWLSASESDEAYRRHKDAFKVKVIFPKTDPTLNGLFTVFDFASKVMHSSVFSIASQTHGLRFQYFDIKGTDDPALIRTFIYIVGAHESMIQAFVGAFRGVLKDETIIDQAVRVFAERLQRHRQTYAKFVMSDLKEETVRKLLKH
jgi:hypothetical protein